ncbi:LLM class flavin-dependent oxidoreductase [Amycolatopsis rhabdoformis]|uniref:LLM class flavin-dependent oxidoreductase n=1 Tax=Amycolatopsis rhabdoformis TaxID=1448059 RepID=A0ABZ1IH30_9PSEU|nr:LLM class flavin-dependent oxidoreductase [Amycolatopsis rhabdoformis]WSE33429.1 LLM class flavin-dependent oxidoreductase [Amycolatopsis rhabdoformis]
MRVGLMFPPGTDPGELPAVARRAEQAGFDFFCCGEHVFFHGPMTNAFVGLAAAAGATERIGLMSALTILPVYPAALAAKLVATLATVSRGRFELGVGVGGEHPPEFEAVGVPLAERGRRTDEALEVLHRLLAGGKVTFRGEFTTIEGQELQPVPQKRPPVWVGGRKGAAMRRAARHADGWLPYLVAPERLAGSLAQVRELAVGYGRQPEDIRGGVYLWSGVDTDGDRARREVVSAVSGIYQQDFESYADRYLLHGTPARVGERLAEYAEAGAESVIFAPACADHDRAIDLFATEVLPGIRARGVSRV